MAITSLDGVVGGQQPPWSFAKFVTAQVGQKWSTTWALAGIPGPGSYNTTLNGGTYSSSGGLVNGQIPHFDPGSGQSYLTRFAGMGQGTTGCILLCDRLWDNGGITITSTSQQAITSPTWPARDVGGATTGKGLMIALEVSAAAGNTQTVTVVYTNTSGTGSRSVSINANQYNGTSTGSLGFFPLVAGDIGVQSIQSVQLGASMLSGTINLVVLRVITAVEVNGATWINARALDCIKAGFPAIYNGTVPFILYNGGTATLTSLQGYYQETQG